MGILLAAALLVVASVLAGSVPSQATDLYVHQGVLWVPFSILLPHPDLVHLLPGQLHAFPWYYFLHRSCVLSLAL